MSTLLIFGLIALLVFGAPIFAVMLGFSLLGATTTGRGISDFAITEIFAMGLDSDRARILATIPLFIFCGYLMAEAKTADRMVRLAKAALGWLPGGLAIVTIFACAVFTTFSGASGVTIVALGGLVMPALIKELYPKRYALGLVAGTGSIGLMFPPALPLIVYATVYMVSAQSLAAGEGGAEMRLIDFSMDRFLFAGIVPGLVLIGILCVMAVAVAVVRKVPRQTFEIRELGRSALAGLPEMLLPVLIIGGLVRGFEIPELAALTAVYVLILEVVVFRDVPIRQIARIIRESMVLVGAIFMIILSASVLTNYFVTEQVPVRLMEWITDRIDSKWVFLIALNLVLILVGMFMDIFSAIVVVVPLIIPVADQFGINPYHLGVIFLINLEVGYLTPPVGLNLFITSFKFGRPITEVMHASLPFLGAMLLALILVTYIPALTVVPGPDRDGRIADLVAEVKAAHERAGMVTEVELPDGSTLSLDDCASITDQMAVLECEAMFRKVSECRVDAGGEPGNPCELEAIGAYAAASGVSADDSLSGLDEIDFDAEFDALDMDDELGDLDDDVEESADEPPPPSGAGGPGGFDDGLSEELDAELEGLFDDL
jgi:C4-dicarboxylate transporter, DctM subunit